MQTPTPDVGLGEPGALRRSLRDLVAISAFPAVWVGQDIPRIAESLADVLFGTVDLDFIHVRVTLEADGTTYETARAGPERDADRQKAILSRMLREYSTPDSFGLSRTISNPLGDGNVQTIVVPIGFAGDSGLLVAGSRRAEFPTESDRLLLGVAANQAAFVLQARRTTQAAAERTRLLALSAEVGHALSQAETLWESLQRSAEALVRHLDGAFARIWTLNEAEQMLELQASAGIYTHLDGPHGRVPVGQFKIGLIARERQPHLTNAVIDDPRISDPDWAKREGMVAFAGYPLLVGRRVVGVMGMFARAPITRTALEAMGAVADGIALGIERRRAEEQLREQNRLVETLHRVGAALAAELDLETLVQVVTDATTQLSGAKFGAFFYNVAGEQGEAYTLYTLSGAPREAFERFPMPRNTPVFGATFRGEGVVRLADVTEDPRYGTMPPYHGMPKGHLPVRGYLAVPVISRGGEVLGGLFFGHPEPGVFTERAERLVVGVASQAAVAMENARLYRDLQQAVRTRDDFLGAVSHDLKNPLASIKGFAQVMQRHLLRSGAPDIGRMTAALAQIDATTTRMTGMVNSLLDVTRLQMGEALELERAPTDLVTLARRLAEEHAQTSTRHTIVVETTEHELMGDWDAPRLERVVDNLLSNAIKYSPDGGDITVHVARQDEVVGRWAMLAVQDRGIGIPPADLPRVFERFHRAARRSHRRQQRRRSGIEIHPSPAAARSGGRTRGACMTYSTGGPSSGLDGATVLVVDDDRRIREAIQWGLETEGLLVETAGDGPEAVERAARTRPDLVILDIGLPMMDGYEVAAALRTACGDRLPILVITADGVAVEKARRVGAFGYLHKPFELDALIAAVRRGLAA